MSFPEAMMHESVWFERPKFVEARENYELFLTKNLSAQLSLTHSDQHDHDGLLSKASSAVAQVASGAGSALINEIAKARDSIKQSLSGMASSVTHAVTAESDANITGLKKENTDLKNLVEKLVEQVAALTVRVTKLEGGSSADEAPAKADKKKAEDDDDDDDDFELFGDDDDEEEEEDESEKERKEELLRKYHEKKASKTKVIAKSSILLDVKPWDDETDMVEVERLCRTIKLDGLAWGASKLVPLAYGIKKLQILCTVVDDLVGTTDLEEAIGAFEDLVQSVDIAAFNKI